MLNFIGSFFNHFIYYWKQTCKNILMTCLVSNKLFINGNFVPSKGGKSFDVLDPSTENVIGRAVAGSKEDVDLAVGSARKAFDTVWAPMDAVAKARILLKVADLI